MLLKDNPEELALTMNGRKRKFTRNDFRQFAQSLKMNEKQVENIFRCFQEAMPMVLNLIEESFLESDKKKEYQQLIQKRDTIIL